MHGDSYTKLVSLLKVLFPLAALALLSTLFLLSRKIDPGQAIPFADKEIQNRLRDQQITGPFFSGATADGDQLSFYADVLTTPDGEIGSNEAQNVRATFNVIGGSTVRLQSDTARFALADDRAELEGGVVINTSTGYELMSDRMISELSSLNVESPGPVSGTSPAGTVEAGSMTISRSGDDGGAQLLFTNRVKLIYKPKPMIE